MEERERLARNIQDQISRILFEDWDPIGLKDILPSDEYDSYVGGVYRLLASGATCERVAEHLTDLERNYFGYHQATKERNMPAAKKLCELNVRL